MKKQSAFTLVELMIVIGIVSILGAFAVPYYQDQVKKGRRSDAQQLMLDISSKEEQYMLAARAYTDNPTNLGISKDGWTCSTTDCQNNFYTVTVTPDNSATPPRYDILAAPKAGSPQDGDGNLTLDSTGVREHAGTTGW